MDVRLTLQGKITYPTLGQRKIIDSKVPCEWDMFSFQEGNMTHLIKHLSYMHIDIYIYIYASSAELRFLTIRKHRCHGSVTKRSDVATTSIEVSSSLMGCLKGDQKTKLQFHTKRFWFPDPPPGIDPNCMIHIDTWYMKHHHDIVQLKVLILCSKAAISIHKPTCCLHAHRLSTWPFSSHWWVYRQKQACKMGMHYACGLIPPGILHIDLTKPHS